MEHFFIYNGYLGVIWSLILHMGLVARLRPILCLKFILTLFFLSLFSEARAPSFILWICRPWSWTRVPYKPYLYSLWEKSLKNLLSHLVYVTKPKQLDQVYTVSRGRLGELLRSMEMFIPCTARLGIWGPWWLESSNISMSQFCTPVLLCTALRKVGYLISRLVYTQRVVRAMLLASPQNQHYIAINY